MRGFLVVALSGLVLNGCVALPPAITLATLALDVGSYAVSGKTVTDHGLSAVMQKDCAVIKVLDEGQFCEEDLNYQQANAVLEPLTAEQVAAYGGAIARPQVVVAYTPSLTERMANRDFGERDSKGYGSSQRWQVWGDPKQDPSLDDASFIASDFGDTPSLGASYSLEKRQSAAYGQLVSPPNVEPLSFEGRGLMGAVTFR